MGEYNLFTQNLFAQGYSFEHHPDYAKLPSPFCSRQLFDISGGFEYTLDYLHQKVYSTGCGLVEKGGDFTNGYMAYKGIRWRPENDNPVVSCPYKKDQCSLRHPFLNEASGGGLSKFSMCNCHEVQIPYDYEQSLKKVCDERDREIRRKYEVFRQERNDHVCRWHARYDEWTESWFQRYDPMVCARNCMNAGGNCDLKHTPISKKRGNVFYDVKITRVRRDDTLFNGQEEISIKKGCRLLETPKSMTICENIVRYGIKDIQRKEEMRYHTERFLCGWKVEVLNVRAEQRESRDLMQDLQDIRDGITVIHASDQIKQNREEKRKRRFDRMAKRERRLEQLIIRDGLDSLETYSPDYRHALKWFGKEKLKMLERQHQEYLEAERNKPHQISLFEFM